MPCKHFLPLVHRTSALIAFVLLLSFWGSTLISELSGNIAWVIRVKTAIPYGFIVLIPALILAGITGMRIAKKSTNPIVTAKKKRMPFIAFNGVVILIPCAFILCYLAKNNQFGTLFITIQSVELLIGALNITLMALNIRAGIKLAQLIKKAKEQKS